MNETDAKNLVQKALESPFDRTLFARLTKNIVEYDDSSPKQAQGGRIKEKFQKFVSSYERIGVYKEGGNNEVMDILIVNLKKDTSLERARTALRNFVANHLAETSELKDAALVAFVPPDKKDWRFSFIKMEYKYASGKVNRHLTSARRYSFLVGENERSHTAQSRLLPLLTGNGAPTLAAIEDAFSIETVTDEFFAEYRNLFHKLVDALDALLKKNSAVRRDFRAKNINVSDFAKKLLGQIVFLYFLQKKGWFGVARGKQWGEGSKHFLRELFEKKHSGYENFFNDILEPLFYEALRCPNQDDYFSQFDSRIPFLNGGLFDPLNGYDWIDTDINLPNGLFSNSSPTNQGDIGDGILDIFDRYNFTVKEDEPLEKEVAVDPEMLGKVFENLLNVTDRKAAGTYYTPREIVHYMCQESLINHLATTLKGKVSKEDIIALISHGDSNIEHDSRVTEKGNTRTYVYQMRENIRKHAKEIDDSLDAIRVCDPAVGSGAFPVGMMNEIVRTRAALTPYLDKTSKRTTYAFKRHAIQNSLYGVDKDAGAVEICKLRLWLSLLVDEDDRHNIQPLPNLDYKIVQGNALLRVEVDLLNGDNFKALEGHKADYFSETDIVKKQRIKEDIDALIHKITSGHEEFDFEVYFSEVFHGSNSGFDVVIANPPYVSALEAKKIISPEERDRYKKRFSSARGAYDLYVLFFELGTLLLKPNGVLTFISPSKWLSAQYAIALREVILQHSLVELADFSQIRAFDAAAVSTLVTMIKKCKESSSVKTTKVTDLGSIGQRKIIENDRQYLTLLPNYIWGFLLSDNIKMVNRLWEKSVSLSEVAKVNGSSTAAEADEYTAYISADKKKQSLKVINTKTIDRISNDWGRVKYKNKKANILSPYLDTAKVNDRRAAMYKSPKLIFSKVAKSITASYDKKGEFASTNTTFVYEPTSNITLGFLAAYLNSKLSDFIYKQFFGGLNMFSSFQFQAPQLRIMAVPKDAGEQEPFIALVDKILAITESEGYPDDEEKKAQVLEYQREIDRLVYALYGLTKAEITIVENHHG